jgi:hypothetical protein
MSWFIRSSNLVKIFWNSLMVSLLAAGGSFGEKQVVVPQAAGCRCR